jgi:hypothetical protein
MMLEWVGTLGTAVVGLAGIAATYWSASKARVTQGDNLQFTITAENDRARLSEKRRIYAGYMGAIGSYVAAERRLAVARDKHRSTVSALRSEFNQSMTDMLGALCELRLIAPENLVVLAVTVVHKLTTSEDTSADFPKFRDALYKLMRDDLGEPEHHRIEVPEIVSHALPR